MSVFLAVLHEKKFNAKTSRYMLMVMPISCLGVLVSTLFQTQKHAARRMLAAMLSIGLFSALFDGLLKGVKYG